MTSIEFTDEHRFDTRKMGFWEYSEPIRWRCLAWVALFIAAASFDYWNSPVSVPGEYDLGGSHLSTQIAAEVDQ